jgi:hypothetical protein
MKRIFIVILVLGFGAVKGGWYGLFAMFILFGLGCLVFQVGVDLFSRFTGQFSQPRKIDLTVYNGSTTPGHPDVEGTSRRHPDPTRPTTDDYMGLITYRLKKGE